MDSRTGSALTGLSLAGYPISRCAIGRFGRAGSAVVEVVCLALLARDATLLARGVTKVLRAGPAALLRAECVAAGLATAANGYPLVAGERPPARGGRLRQASLAALFGLHTVRLRIYLRPGQGRRTNRDGSQADAAGR